MSKTALREFNQARQYHQDRIKSRAAAKEQERRRQYARVRAAIQRIAPRFPAVQSVYLFGSLVRSGYFNRHSDIDVAVQCNDVQAESDFWQALEAELDTPVDLRPYRGAVAWAVDTYGECIYERNLSHS